MGLVFDGRLPSFRSLSDRLLLLRPLPRIAFGRVVAWLRANTLCLDLRMQPWQTMDSCFHFLLHCLVLPVLQMRCHTALARLKVLRPMLPQCIVALDVVVSGSDVILSCLVVFPGLDCSLSLGQSLPLDPSSSRILKRSLQGAGHDDSFHYRSVIGRLNYQEKCTRPDISCAVHQYARFSANPKRAHANAVRWIGRYLLATRDKGLIFKPSGNSFDVYVDSDFSGNWDQEGAPDDPDTARSRTGYVIEYAGCPIVWVSKLQTLIALSSTEAEYISLSTSLRETIPIMELLREIRDQGFDIKSSKPTVHCKVFEDNSGALAIATVHKVRPRTKHLNVQLHHFRQYVEQGDITIHKIDTTDQKADILTKSLPIALFVKHRLAIMGW